MKTYCDKRPKFIHAAMENEKKGVIRIGEVMENFA